MTSNPGRLFRYLEKKKHYKNPKENHCHILILWLQDYIYYIGQYVVVFLHTKKNLLTLLVKL